MDSYKQTHSKSISFESPFVTFSACGVMTGMTREQVYAQLQMTPWCQVLVDHSFADFTWELIPRYDGSEEYSLRVDTREYTDSDIVLSERLDSKTMCSLSLKFENDVLTWMQYRETKIDCSSQIKETASAVSFYAFYSNNPACPGTSVCPMDCIWRTFSAVSASLMAILRMMFCTVTSSPMPSR